MSTAVQVTLIIIGGLIGAAVSTSLFKRVNRMSRRWTGSMRRESPESESAGKGGRA